MAYKKKKKKVCTYFHIIQYLKRSYLQKRSVFTEALLASDSECSTWPWFTSLFQSIIALPYRQRVTPVLERNNKQKTIMFLSYQISADKNQECGSPFLMPSRILHFSVTSSVKCTWLHIGAGEFNIATSFSLLQSH